MVKVRVKYFGKIRELIGIKEEEYEIEDSLIVDLLSKHIPGKHSNIADEWREMIFTKSVRESTANRGDTLTLKENFLILVNGRASEANYRLRDGDEVAILPPVEGG